MRIIDRVLGRRKNTPLGVILIVMAEIFWGINVVVLSLAFEHFPILLLMGIRYLLAGSILAIFTWHRWKKLNAIDLKNLALSSLVGLALSQLLFNVGLASTSPMLASVIMALSPVVLYFFSLEYLKEEFEPKVFVGSVIALGGVLLVVSDPSGGGAQSLLGALAISVSLLADAFGVVTKKKIMKRINPMQIVTVNFLIGSVPLLLISSARGELASIAVITPIAWLYLGFIVLFGSIAAFSFYYNALNRVSVERSSVYNYLLPVTGVIASILIVGTIPDNKFIFGTILVGLGLGISQVRLPHDLHLLHRHRR